MSVPGFRSSLTFVAVLSASALTSNAWAAPAPDAAQDKDQAAAASPADGTKLLILPYQPILRSVAQNKVKQATEFLAKELGNTEGLQVIMGGVATSQDSDASLEQAMAHVKAADEAEKAKNIPMAIELTRKAIAEMEKNAAAVTDVAPYVDAHHRLARALMWTGADAKAKAAMETAARLSPNYELSSSEYSRMYRRWFVDIAKKIVRERPGELLVKSGLPGAAVKLDGREMDVAPVLIQRIVPGKHLITAQVDGVPPFGAVVTVKANKQTEFAANFKGVLGGVEVGDVTDAIAKNELPAKIVKKAVQAGKNVGAEFVVVGGLAKDRVGNDLNVHTFLVKVADAKIKALDPVDFDSEMLTAESDVIRVVRQVDAAVKDFGDAQPMVAMIESRTSGFSRTTLNKVSGQPARPNTQIRRDPKVKKGRRRVFRALEGASIRIKDEEE